MSRWLKDYSFELPPGRIAQVPLPRREDSRLLVLERGAGRVRHRRFRSLPSLLDRGDLLVLNDSAVMPARLRGRKAATGGAVELLLLRRLSPGIWRALARGSAPAGTVLEFGLPGPRAEISAREGEGSVTVRFDPAGSEEELMDREGEVPLPPYIRREGPASPRMRSRDRRRYQTLYASCRGSAAAPTAGLHFGGGIFRRLEERGVERAFVTLHVGAGTFRPLRHEDLSRAVLESERAFVPEATAAAFERAKARGGRVVAVGTTVTRTLESFADGRGGLGRGWREVDLLIRPGYRFRAVDALLTNFHLPRSSLLLLVCAFAGRERTLEAYRLALQAGYRFYSYGDAMLVL